MTAHLIVLQSEHINVRPKMLDGSSFVADKANRYVFAVRDDTLFKKFIIIQISKLGAGIGMSGGVWFVNKGAEPSDDKLDFGTCKLAGKRYQYSTFKFSPQTIFDEYYGGCGLLRYNTRVAGSSNNYFVSLVYYECLDCGLSEMSTSPDLHCNSLSGNKRLAGKHRQYLVGFNKRMESAMGFIKAE